jgi:predicted 3-demethylubiquinone-9 3-methyltransferase (glyoxalase superfamily)
MYHITRKITPFLWFEDDAEEAMKFYVEIFEDSRIININRYGEGSLKGKVMTGEFQLEGQQFIAMDGGTEFSFTPAVSFFVNCVTEDKLDRYYSQLVDGGSVLMPLKKYPFGEKYTWVTDKYGVSWQLYLDSHTPNILPCIMFICEEHGKTEEAINFYTSLFEKSAILSIAHYDIHDEAPGGTIKHGRFLLYNQEFLAFDSHQDHDFSITGAISFYVDCDSQEEVDSLWEALSQGGEILQCGWLKDKYGVTWQIIPSVLPQLLSDPDTEKAKRVNDAMLKMKKIDIGELQKAYNGEK